VTSDVVEMYHVLAAAGLTYLVGFERDVRRAGAGDRVFALIGTGAGVVGVLAAHGAPTALTGVLTGVGFIGAGLLFRQERPEFVRGLTTAAAILAAVAIGAAAGDGQVLIAGVGTGVTLLILEARYLPIFRWPVFRLLDARLWAARARHEEPPRRSGGRRVHGNDADSDGLGSSSRGSALPGGFGRSMTWCPDGAGRIMDVMRESRHLASIHLYPVKAMRAIDLGESRVEPWGLAGDRRWLVVDRTGRFVSQREEPGLARVVARYEGPGLAVTLSAPGRAPITVRAPRADAGAPLVPVSVWRSDLFAAAAGQAADDWLSGYLESPVRLVHLDDPLRRPVDQEYGAPGDTVSFADGYPLLLTNASSLDELGKWLADDGEEPVPMNRFRPSVVVAGTEPWEEDGWRRIRIGAVAFRVAKPCGRCVVTTTDQATGERGSQPLKMLGRKRQFGQDLVFGQNLIPDERGVIRVGDPVDILE